MKNILLISTGSSPQVLTETLWYFSQATQPIYFDEVYAITTKKGNKLIIENLLSGPCYFEKFYQDYNIEKDSDVFTENHIHVLKDSKGNELEDIKTVSENNAAIHQIFDIVNDLTKDDNTRLITSVSGGRKTMSVILGQAMQFFAREQDKVIHVIVDNEIVGREFYYPTPYKKLITIDDKKIDFSQVKIYLDELPIVRLRSIIGPLLIPNDESSLLDLVKVAQSQIDGLQKSPKISIDLKTRNFFINEYQIKLPAKQFAIYCAFLDLKLDDYIEDNTEKGFIHSNNLFSDDFLSSFYFYYSKVYKPKSIFVVRLKEQIEDPRLRSLTFNIDWFKPLRSKINKTLNQILPPSLYHYCEITSNGFYGDTKYGVLTEKAHIRII